MKLSINTCIAIIGLGSPGLPLAVEFGEKYPALGFDINHKRVKELREGIAQAMPEYMGQK